MIWSITAHHVHETTNGVLLTVFTAVQNELKLPKIQSISDEHEFSHTHTHKHMPLTKPNLKYETDRISWRQIQ